MHAEHDPQLSAAERADAARLRRLLEAGAAPDLVTRARLDAARRRALDPLSAAAPAPQRVLPWAGAALAASLALALGVWNLRTTPAETAGAEALEWLSLAPDQTGLVEELEFYEWLSAEVRDG
ncbi:MAG: hypothetical protein ACT4PG_06480 [Panacagrimonas sp.]